FLAETPARKARSRPRLWRALLVHAGPARPRRIAAEHVAHLARERLGLEREREIARVVHRALVVDPVARRELQNAAVAAGLAALVLDLRVIDHAVELD